MNKIMKSTLCVLSALTLSFGLFGMAACGDEDTPPGPDTGITDPTGNQGNQGNNQGNTGDNQGNNQGNTGDNQGNNQGNTGDNQGNNQGNTGDNQGNNQGNTGDNQGNNQGNTGDNQGNNQGNTGDNNSFDDVVGGQYILPHDENKTVTYLFEAENTNLDAKSGVGYSSGDMKGVDLVSSASDASNGQYVVGLYTQGISVNFLVVSDRDVEDATLTIRVAAEFMDMLLTPENYAVRIDQVPEIELQPLNKGGSWGDWEGYFLGTDNDGNEYYPVDGEEHFYLDEWDCEEIHLDASHQQPQSKPTDWAEFTITTNLRLFKGVTSISFITDNSDIQNLGTMRAMAPMFDCIYITTNAQLGMYSPVANMDDGKNACKILDEVKGAAVATAESKKYGEDA